MAELVVACNLCFPTAQELWVSPDQGYALVQLAEDDFRLFVQPGHRDDTVLKWAFRPWPEPFGELDDNTIDAMNNEEFKPWLDWAEQCLPVETTVKWLGSAWELVEDFIVLGYRPRTQEGLGVFEQWLFDYLGQQLNPPDMGVPAEVGE